MSGLLAASELVGSSGAVSRFLIVLGLMLAAGKAAAVLCARAGQAPVLGELVVGILLGAGGVGLIPTALQDPLTPVVRLLAQVGIVLLLFEIGLETDLKTMLAAGPAAVAVSLVGVVVTFAATFVYWVSPLHAPGPDGAGLSAAAAIVAAALAATSVGITARVLRDRGDMDTAEARLILGAAVLDDVLGLVILSVALGAAGGRAPSVASTVRLVVVGVGFLIAALATGVALASRVFDIVDRMRARGTLVVASFAFLLVLAALAERAGSAPIIGAFAAGLILSGTRQARTIGQQMRPVADIFVPMFFLSVGAAADLRAFNPLDAHARGVLGIAGTLLLLAFLGKLVAGWAAPWRPFNRWAVGVGLVPRGEVALVAASGGLASGLLSPDIFSAILCVVIVTTLVTPPLLGFAFARGGATRDGATRGPERAG